MPKRLLLDDATKSDLLHEILEVFFLVEDVVGLILLYVLDMLYARFGDRLHVFRFWDLRSDDEQFKVELNDEDFSYSSQEIELDWLPDYYEVRQLRDGTICILADEYFNSTPFALFDRTTGKKTMLPSDFLVHERIVTGVAENCIYVLQREFDKVIWWQLHRLTWDGTCVARSTEPMCWLWEEDVKEIVCCNPNYVVCTQPDSQSTLAVFQTSVVWKLKICEACVFWELTGHFHPACDHLLFLIGKTPTYRCSIHVWDLRRKEMCFHLCGNTPPSKPPVSVECGWNPIVRVRQRP